MRAPLRSLVLSLLLFCLDVCYGQVLAPGDVAIVGINANNGGCSGSTAEDEISFICFKSISTGTRLWLTDKGYEYQNAGFWGTVNEGVVQLQRTGAALPIGTVTTLRINGGGTVTSVSAGWTATTIVANMNLNSGGDQVFIFQANAGSAFSGTANNGVFTNCTLLYGFSTRAVATAWLSFQNSTQYSGLPPGMLCFSMAPASASDFVKYVAPAPDVFPTYTMRTQRQWIIEMDDAARWSSYGTCTVYNTATAASPNYAGGFVFPVAPGGFVNGVWTGAKTTDWFDCRNWDDAEVPTAASNVVINPVNAPINSCVIGVTASPPTAVCNTLNVTTAGSARTLTIQNAGVLQVGSTITVTNTGVNAFNGVILADGSMTSGHITVSGTGLQRGGIRNEVATNTFQVNGNLTINAGGLLDLEGAGTGGVLGITGNYANAVDATAFEDLNSVVNFNGTAQQYISTAGSFQEQFHSISLNKSTNDLNLNAPIALRGSLTLNNGRLTTSGTNILTMGNTSSANSWSNSSFVNGPMVKVGTSDFIFPVGKGNVVREIAVTNVTGGPNDAFRAEYFPSDPHVATGLGPAIETPALDHISYCEYWYLNRVVNAPIAKVTLSWKAPYSCGVTNLTDLRVAKWDQGSSMWLDRGNDGNTTGNTAAGTVTTLAFQEVLFHPGWWTLASASADNPLPVELLHFTARPVGREVELDWATASEQENDHFTVERSSNGIDFVDLLRVDGAGNSSQVIDYSAMDPWPLSGWNYYRLRQTDIDETNTTSDMVAVRMTKTGAGELVLARNADELLALHPLAVGSEVSVLDMTGRVVWNAPVTSEGRASVPLGDLMTGAYVLRLSDGLTVLSAPFVR